MVVPVFNTQEYLDNCLASIASQTHQRLNIIVVDDGSTDGSPSICHAWSQRDPRVHLISQENQGLSRARNVGIEASEGQWITFVDSDDVIAPDFVEQHLQVLTCTGAELSSGALVSFVDDPPKFTRSGQARASKGWDELKEIVQDKDRWEACGRLYNRMLFAQGLRFRVGMKYEDIEFTARVYASAKQTARLDAALYGYRKRPDGIMGQSQSVGDSVDLVWALESAADFVANSHPSPSAADEIISELIHHGLLRLTRMPGGICGRRPRLFREAFKQFSRKNLASVKRAETLTIPVQRCIKISCLSPWLAAVYMRFLRRAALIALRFTDFPDKRR
ncbi:glycosyltransferase family 2 protein [Ammonicoccus fulvus]|uniref:glycosyltransferase family 2 protein n=1 Tax=Ammonicoccus fulvus TaxID=3138240 RepID=UPI003CC7FCEC